LTLSPLGVNSFYRFDLVLLFNDPDGSPFATWMYNPHLFDDSTHEKSLSFASRRCHDPSIKLSSLHQLLAEAEQQEREASQNILRRRASAS
jgi:hypothetical protein